MFTPDNADRDVVHVLLILITLKATGRKKSLSLINKSVVQFTVGFSDVQLIASLV